MSTEPILDRILTLLGGAGCPYQRIDHEPVSSAREAAHVRGTDLASGVKAILFKIDRDFVLFAMAADRRLRSAKIRRSLGVRRTRFASREELLEMTGLTPGAVPPFGRPVLPFPLYADPSVFSGDHLIFTAGSRTTSIRMTTEDYRRLAAPRVVAVAEPDDPDSR